MGPQLQDEKGRHETLDSNNHVFESQLDGLNQEHTKLELCSQQT